MPPIQLVVATPRKLPKPRALVGRVVVLDVAFASEAGGGGFGKVTQPFIDGLGDRLRAWVDHHDSEHHALYAGDPRFVLATKAEHPACPEMVTPELVERVGPIETIVCHGDFDGLASAAKWMRGGLAPYPGCDADARAVDTRLGRPGPIGAALDRAIRARPRDLVLAERIARHLASGLEDRDETAALEAIGAEVAPLEAESERLAASYRVLPPGVAIVDVRERIEPYDKTHLLLLGQELAAVAVVVDTDSATFAAAFDSGIDFLKLFGLSGGMPTVVSVPPSRVPEGLAALGVRSDAGGPSDLQPLDKSPTKPPR
jgi:hypothetical protein